MPYSNRAMIEALTIIRDTCREMECEKCPFYEPNDRGCVINDMLPSEWYIDTHADAERIVS